MENNQNFFITKLDRLINWARTNSLWPISLAGSCCYVEINQSTALQYDLESLGLSFRDTLEEADVLLIAGPITPKIAPRLRQAYEQIPDPKWVVAVGACANGGGYFNNCYAVIPSSDHIIPVDLYIPGCPPTPEAFIYGLTQLQNKIKCFNKNKY